MSDFYFVNKYKWLKLLNGGFEMKRNVFILMAIMAVGTIAFGIIEAPTIDGKLISGYDGSDVATVYDAVSGERFVTSWNDQVGPYNAFKPSDARRPRLIYEDTGTGIEVPVLDFDGINDYLDTTAYAAVEPQDNIILVVAKLDRQENNTLINGIDLTNKNAFGTSSIGKYYIDAGTAISSGSYMARTNGYFIYSLLFQSGSGGNSRAYITDINGPGTSKQLMLGNVGAMGLSGLRIGAYSSSNPDGVGFLDGKIAEILIYQRSMYGVQLEEIEQYLYNKYLKPTFDLVDNFESYDYDVKPLSTNWTEAGNAWLALRTNDPTYTKNYNSMELHYTNSTSPYFSSADLVFATPRNWDVNDLTTLEFSVIGKDTNGDTELYVELSDGTNTVKVVHIDPPDANTVQSTQWQRISFPFEAFAGINFANITKLTIGAGNGTDPGEAINGDIYIDDIRLFPARCVNKPQYDLNGDCVIDFSDFALLSNEWLESGFEQ